VKDARRDICVGIIGAIFAWDAQWYRFHPAAKADADRSQAQPSPEPSAPSLTLPAR
jgi:hypothetical protein